MLLLPGAIALCKRSTFIFARPEHWTGTGKAIDLGSKLDLDGQRIMVVQPLGTASFIHFPWNPTVEDLCARWRLVGRILLAMELEAPEKEEKTAALNIKEKYGLEINEE